MKSAKERKNSSEKSETARQPGGDMLADVQAYKLTHAYTHTHSHLLLLPCCHVICSREYIFYFAAARHFRGSLPSAACSLLLPFTASFFLPSAFLLFGYIF